MVLESLKNPDEEMAMWLSRAQMTVENEDPCVGRPENPNLSQFHVGCAVQDSSFWTLDFKNLEFELVTIPTLLQWLLGHNQVSSLQFMWV